MYVCQHEDIHTLHIYTVLSDSCTPNIHSIKQICAIENTSQNYKLIQPLKTIHDTVTNCVSTLIHLCLLLSQYHMLFQTSQLAVFQMYPSSHLYLLFNFLGMGAFRK